MQIKTTEISKYRAMFATKQKYKCPICKSPLLTRAALDHSHTTGELRGTLCNTCNRNEGKVKKAIQYMAKVTHLSKIDYIQWMKNLISYLEYYKENPTGIIHPTFDVEKGKQKPVKRTRRKK